MKSPMASFRNAVTTLLLLLAWSCTPSSHATDAGDSLHDADAFVEAGGLADSSNPDTLIDWADCPKETLADSSPEDISAPEVRRYRVVSSSIVTSNDERVFLRGVNIDNASKYTPGFLVDISDEELARLPSQGINSVRLLTFWNAISPDVPGVYDEDYLDRYALLVEKLSNLGLFVIIDMHQDLWGPPFEVHGAPHWACPEEMKEGYVATAPWWSNYLSRQVTACFDNFWASQSLQDRYAETWAHLAQRVCGNPNVLGFDIMNEPYAASMIDDPEFESEILYGLYKKTMDSVEASCPGRLYFLEHSWTFWLSNFSPMPMEEGFADRVVFSPHYYRTELHEPEGDGYVLSWQELFSVWDNLWQNYKEASWPIWLGEFGGFTDLPGYADFIKDAIHYIEGNGVGTALYGWGRSDGGFAFVGAAGAMKPVLSPIYRTPLPTLLPGAGASHSTDFDTGVVEATFHCHAGATTRWLLPMKDSCQCSAEPEDALSLEQAQGTFSSWSCTRETPVVQRCQCPSSPR